MIASCGGVYLDEYPIRGKRRKEFMKKMIAVLLLCCLLLSTALAEIPTSWTAWLAPLQSRLDAGYTVSAMCIVPDICAHVVLSRDGRNQLAIVRLTDGKYETELLATHALRQGAEIPALLADDGESLSLFYRHEDGTEDAYVYRRDSTGTWVLSSYTVATGEYSWRSFAAEEGRLVYSYYENNEKVKERNVYGVYQREVKYLNVETLPTTLEEARAKLTQPPEIPTGGLTAKNVKFTSGKKYAVYSGPGKDYLRAADGKAAVSTNDWIQVFGTADGWALIQYDLSSDQMRFGYIDEDALPAGAGVNELAFAPVDAYTTRRVGLTDDPLNQQLPLLTLPEGAWVTWLATMGEWAYVESSTGDLVRGFIPVSALTNDRSFSLADHRYGTAAAAMEGSLTVRADGTVTLLVETWKADASGRQPLRFEVYNERNNELVLTASANQVTGCYEGRGRMSEGWSLLICPVYAEGTADMSAAMSIQW